MVAPYVPRGTLLVELKPSSIMAAAEADVKRWLINKSSSDWPPHYYAFHRLHVRRAMKTPHASGREIIMAAILDLDRGRESGKRSTRELYRDIDLLRAALGSSQ